MVCVKYFKTMSVNGELLSLGHSEVNCLSGIEIFKSEYNNLRVGLRIFQEGIDPEIIKQQSWWK